MRNHDRLPSAIDVKVAFQKARDTYIHDYCYSGDISGSTSTIVIKYDLCCSTDLEMKESSLLRILVIAVRMSAVMLVLCNRIDCRKKEIRFL